MYKKQRTTVWTNGQAVSSVIGETSREELETDILETRESYAGFASTLSIEETATTLVIVKESGVTHVYNWTL
jgi:hypothetical protein